MKKALLFLSSLFMIFLYGCQSTDEEETYNQFITSLQALTPEAATDFRPQREYDGWTYFYVPDEESIYRFRAEAEQPELVLTDCADIADVQGDRLYYCKDPSELWYLDLRDQSTQKACEVTFYRSTVTLLNDTVIISDYGYVGIYNLSHTSQQRKVYLTIDGLYVIDLIWCDGSTLYYTAAENYDDALMNPAIYRWDFVHAPVQIMLPENYDPSWIQHKGNVVFLVEVNQDADDAAYGERKLAALTLPDESFTVLQPDRNTLIVNNPDVYYAVYQQGSLSPLGGSTSEEEHAIALLNSQGYWVSSYQDDFAICHKTETHADGSSQCKGKACENYDDGYYHHYTRTSIYRIPSCELVWDSNGEHFWWDT